MAWLKDMTEDLKEMYIGEENSANLRKKKK